MKTNTKAPKVKRVTHEGGPAKRINASQELRRTAMACLLWENSFYESGVSVADRIADLVPKVSGNEAMDIAVEVYEISLLLPNDEKFNLIHQIKKCAVSIPSNIAEGSGRNHNKEFIQFLSYSKGSCGELRSQLYRAFDRKHITEEEFELLKEKTITESKKIGSFMSYLVKSENNGSKFNK
jgi:four helix bundle protein